MQEPKPDLLTIRDVARACDVRVHRAKYAIDAYAIEPRQRAGIVRLWSPDQLPHIQNALRRSAGRRPPEGGRCLSSPPSGPK